MSFEDFLETNEKREPPRILLHGSHGLGKSTWASIAPNPIFIQTESGLGEIKPKRFPLSETVADVYKNIGLLINEDHDFKTVVVDTIDWWEAIVHQEIAIEKGVESISDIGYQKGYDYAINRHVKLLSGLTKLWSEKGMAVILLAHNEIKPYNNPEGENYDQFVIKLHKKAAKKFEEFCDAILFLNHKAYITKKDGALKAKVTGSGERSIFTQPRPAFTAKCRYDVPFEIPVLKGTGFKDFLKLIK